MDDKEIAEQCFNEKSFVHGAISDDENAGFPWMTVYLSFLVIFHLMHAFVAYDQYRVFQDEARCKE